MLTQFTWQQFLVAITVLSLIWYCSVILLFYRKELKRLLNGKPLNDSTSEPLAHRWAEKFDVLEQQAEDHLMGKSRLPDGVEIVGMDEIQFVEPDPKTQRLGLIPDVLEEVKTIFDILSKEDGNKQDFLALMQTVKENYPKIASHPNLPQVNDFIISNASFHLSPDELENIWY